MEIMPTAKYSPVQTLVRRHRNTQAYSYLDQGCPTRLETRANFFV